MRFNYVMLNSESGWKRNYLARTDNIIIASSFLRSPHSDITLRYKETRQRKQEAPADRDRPLGNGSTATPSGRSKLNGSSETLRQRKSWGRNASRSRSVSSSWRGKDKVWWGKMRRMKEWHKDTCRGKQMDTIVLQRLFLCLHEPSSHSTEARGGRGNFHSVHCLVIVLLQGFTSFYFLRTFGELYTGQDTFSCYLYITLDVGWWGAKR